MSFDVGSLVRLALFSARRPRQGADYLLGLGVSRAAIWPSMLLVAVLSSLLYALQNTIAAPSEAAIVFSPFTVALMSVFSMIAIAGNTYWIGRIVGGTGSFWDALLLITFMQVILIGLQLIQSAVSLITLGFDAFFLCASLGLTLWLLINFTAAAHNFSSRAKAFGVVVAAFFATGLSLAILLGVFGVAVGGV